MWTLKIQLFPKYKIDVEYLPVFDQPVVVPALCAVAHNQHSMVHVVGACVVPVHTCGAHETGVESKTEEVYIYRFTQKG